MNAGHKRLDHYLLEKWPQYSRSRLQSWIKQGRVLVNGVGQNITFNSTGAWTTWATQNVTFTFNNGTVNTIRFESNGQDLANIDQVEIL